MTIISDLDNNTIQLECSGWDNKELSWISSLFWKIW